MSISLSGSDLINMAIGIERRGIAFYDIMIKSTENAAARNIFQYLVDMERQHIQIFEGMLDEADELQTPETITDEYAAYLKALVESAVFTDDLATSEMATQADTAIEAIELAMVAEKDSILFYYEMKDRVPNRVQPTVNKILAEEKSHLWQLSELKKQLTSL